MENFFGINYEFDFEAICSRIDETLQASRPGYVCVSDGVILATYHSDAAYAAVVDGALFSICDSSFVPLYIRFIHHLERPQLSGSDLMMRLVERGRYRLAFLGGSSKTLASLRERLSRVSPAAADALYMELPFCPLDGFDYEDIARQLEAFGAEVVFVSLGAPKQEFFMSRLKPYLGKGVLFAVGAAFKFHSDSKEEKRAPRWMLRHHLEFLWRIYQSPRKQLPRCWKILRVTPRVLWRERRKLRQSRRESEGKRS